MLIGNCEIQNLDTKTTNIIKFLEYFCLNSSLFKASATKWNVFIKPLKLVKPHLIKIHLKQYLPPLLL